MKKNKRNINELDSQYGTLSNVDEFIDNIYTSKDVGVAVYLLSGGTSFSDHEFKERPSVTKKRYDRIKIGTRNDYVEMNDIEDVWFDDKGMFRIFTIITKNNLMFTFALDA